MATAVPYEPNTADGMILDSLAGEGRNLPQNLARDLDYSRQYVQNRLQMLEAAGYVDNIGGGLYEITTEGREELEDD